MTVTQLLSLAVQMEASDLHLAVGSPPMVRVYGELQALKGFPPLTPHHTQEMMEALTDERQRQEFYAKKELDFGHSLIGSARFRVNACFERGSISLSCRLLPPRIPTMEELGIPEVCKDLATRPRGLVLVTGPTGSGKSTTLASMIDYLNENFNRRIITIEDPIEYLHLNKKCMILQREVGKDTDAFATALRHALRQDPNVILIGEMRDLETMATSLSAAETGHLVLSTLHTSDATQTVDRIIDLFPPHQQHQVRLQLSLALEGVLSQLLIPKADGSGRVAAFEVLLGNPAIRSLIREGKTYEIPNYLQLGRQQGMQTMDWALGEMVVKRLISLDMALSLAHSPENMKKMISQMGRVPQKPVIGGQV